VLVSELLSKLIALQNFPHVTRRTEPQHYWIMRFRSNSSVDDELAGKQKQRMDKRRVIQHFNNNKSLPFIVSKISRIKPQEEKPKSLSRGNSQKTLLRRSSSQKLVQGSSPSTKGSPTSVSLQRIDSVSSFGSTSSSPSSASPRARFMASIGQNLSNSLLRKRALHSMASQVDVEDLSEEQPKKLLEGNEVQFELVLTHKELRDHFQEFLHTAFNGETLMFIMAVTEFENTIDPVEKVAKALDIVDNFVLRNSPHEINIDNKKRAPVVNALDETNQRAMRDKLLIPPKTFEQLYKHVAFELKEDGFPRYVRSESFYDFVTSKGTQFIYDIIMPSLNHNLPTFDIGHLLKIQELHDQLLLFAEVCFLLDMLTFFRQIILMKISNCMMKFNSISKRKLLTNEEKFRKKFTTDLLPAMQNVV
jgi:hypothetical protein